MSEFLKLAYELIAKIIYNIVQCFVAIFRLFFTGWPEYIMIFNTYFYTLSVPAKILALLLVLILIAIPILIIVLICGAARPMPSLAVRVSNMLATSSFNSG